MRVLHDCTEMAGTAITDHIIRRESGEYDPEVVKRLSLERFGIIRIQNLERCLSLVDLSLAGNEVCCSAAMKPTIMC